MSEIIGQKKLLNKINKLSIDTFPRTVLLCGENGSGRHTVANYIGDYLKVPVVDITFDLHKSSDKDSKRDSVEVIADIATSTELKCYIIDIDELTIKEENVILKLLEEPPMSAYLILLCEDKNRVIQTVLNRCQVWDMDKYSNEELSKFLFDKNSTDILNIVRTPGQILKMMSYNLTVINSFIEKIYSCIGNASFANILVIPNKIKFKDTDVDSICDYDIFIKLLLNNLVSKIESASNKKYTTAYFRTSKLINDSKIKYIDKRILFENYLLDLKHILSDSVKQSLKKQNFGYIPKGEIDILIDKNYCMHKRTQTSEESKRLPYINTEELEKVIANLPYTGEGNSHDEKTSNTNIPSQVGAFYEYLFNNNRIPNEDEFVSFYMDRHKDCVKVVNDVCIINYGKSVNEKIGLNDLTYRLKRSYPSFIRDLDCIYIALDSQMSEKLDDVIYSSLYDMQYKYDLFIKYKGIGHKIDWFISTVNAEKIKESKSCAKTDSVIKYGLTKYDCRIVGNFYLYPKDIIHRIINMVDNCSNM